MSLELAENRYLGTPGSVKLSHVLGFLGPRQSLPYKCSGAACRGEGHGHGIQCAEFAALLSRTETKHVRARVH